MDIQTKYEIVYNSIIIIHLIDNNLLLFINDYKLQLVKLLKDNINRDPLFILDLNNDELKDICNTFIKKMIK